MQTVMEFLNGLADAGVKLAVEGSQLNCYARGPLGRDIRDGIIRFKPEIIALLQAREDSRPSTGKKPARALEFPLSAGEKGLYILQKLNPGMSAYNVPMCFTISNRIDQDQLNEAWGFVQEQYPLLKARIVEKDGGLYHLLDDKCKTVVRQQAIDFADEQQLVQFLRQQAKRPFDLNQGPLARIDLFTRERQDHILLITIHHIVFDGTSGVILLKSLFDSYRQLRQGRRPVADSLPGYQAFVEWEEAMLASDEGRAHADYWKQQLDGDLPVVELPADVTREIPATGGYDGKTLVRELPPEISGWVFEFSRAQSVPPAAIFLGLFQLLLHKYTGQEDIIVGMPVMGRASREFAFEIGYFINMVPLRTCFSAGLKLGGLLRKTQGVMLDALYHSAYPFPMMLDRQKFKKAEKNPVFQVAYAYQNYVQESDFTSSPEQRELGIEPVPGIYQEGDFDLGLEVYEGGASFRLHLKYNPDLYTQEAIERLYGHYCVLLQAAAANPDALLQEYPILTDAEKHRLLTDFNDTQADFPEDKCVHQLFAEQAAAIPDSTAVEYEDQRLSYQELYERSCDLALYLQSLGVRADSLVGLCVERSLEMMVGIQGILQSDGAYVSLDPDYPADRLAYMLEESASTVVLTQERFRDKLEPLVSSETRVIALDTQWREIGECAARLKAEHVGLRREAGPGHVAYVIYTSGSTGKPKGVMVEHKALMNRIHWMQKRYPLTRDDVVLQKTPYSFDVSVWEFVWPMMTGASVVFAVPNGHKDVDYLEDLINRKKVTTVHFVPSMFNIFLENVKSACGSVRQIFCSGEALGKKAVDSYRIRFPNSALHNLYGPTEAAIDVTSYDCSGLNYPFVPIGAPIDNIQIHILDRDHNLQPVGIPGELYIAGVGLARGYLNRPDLTRERFVPNPFVPGARMYKTGDLARWLNDGNIEYLGRIDTQVKIRGFRIETGEIEARLNQHPDISDSVVVARGQDSNKQLVAFYVAKGATAGNAVHLPGDDLKSHLQQTLPDYMTPAAFVSLEAIPLSPNGKADRRVLERMDISLESSRAYLAPRDAMEKQLVDIWAETLNLEPGKIGVNDNFFELGGHSLLATQLVSRIRGQLGADLPLKALFDVNTLAGMADLVKIIRLQHEQTPHADMEDVEFEEVSL